MTATAAPIPLEYGRRAPAWLRRRTWLILGLLAAMTVASILGARTWPRVRATLDERRFNREARAWYAAASARSEPATTVKLSTFLVDREAAWKQFVDEWPAATGDVATGGPFATAQWGSPLEKSIIAGGSGDAFSGSGATVFMHARKAGDDSRRLLCVSYAFRSGPIMRFHALSYAPIGERIVPTPLPDVSVDFTPAGDGENIRIFAGRPDRNDTSRFTIPFESHGRPGVIDGVLESEPGTAGLRVRLTPRLLATTAPARR